MDKLVLSTERPRSEFIFSFVDKALALKINVLLFFNQTHSGRKRVYRTKSRRDREQSCQC